MLSVFKSTILIFTTAICSYVAHAQTQGVETAPYCLAIRGNGDAMPAHWGAIAKITETQGLPKMMAGGSSATISMFLIEAMASHPLVQDSTESEKGKKVSLLLKSLHGFTNSILNRPDIQELKLIFSFGLIAKGTLEQKIEKIETLLLQKNWEESAQLISSITRTEILNMDAFNPLYQAIKMKNQARALFYRKEISDSLKALGSFNAATDSNVLFRTGLINFEKLPNLLSRVAEFYSAQNGSSQLKQRWVDFFDSCTTDSLKKTWAELVNTNPSCQTQLQKLITSHFEENQNPVAMQDLEIGYRIPVLASTSILVDSAADEFQQNQALYHAQINSQFGKSFKLSDPSKVLFGYWGSIENLNRINQNLSKNDEKSRRFYSLGNAKWKDVLALSPAEPGLSKLKTFQNQDKTLVSAGGWSDLHPSLILKAAGCKNVTYVTRQGGESFFAQAMTVRLMQDTRPMQMFNNENPAQAVQNKKTNNVGNPQDLSSLGSRLYNLANQQSSFVISLKQMDQVICTNWDSFSSRTQLAELIDNAYKSPRVMANSQSSKIPGCTFSVR